MPDVSHNWGEDLGVSPTGDLALVDGLALGQQRILRRLLTNKGDYLWHLNYGAGLPSKIGSLLDIPALKSLIRSQLFQEAAVARNPQATITIRQTSIEAVTISIAYSDAVNGQQLTLSFDLNQ